MCGMARRSRAGACLALRRLELRTSRQHQFRRPQGDLIMPDLMDGESVEMQGSASRPYVLKNVGGVFSCSCAGWRFQSLPIEKRTCRHLRALRGDVAENARVGGILSTESKEKKGTPTAPRLLLAERWDST